MMQTERTVHERPLRTDQRFWDTVWRLAKVGVVLSAIGVLCALVIQFLSGNSVALSIAHVVISTLKALGFSVSIGTATTFGTVSAAVTFAGAAVALTIGLPFIFVVLYGIKSFFLALHQKIFIGSNTDDAENALDSPNRPFSETVLSEGLDIAISRFNDDAIKALLFKISDSGLLCKSLCTAIEAHNIRACKTLLNKISIEDLLQHVSDEGVLYKVLCIKIEDGDTGSIDALLASISDSELLCKGLCAAIEKGNQHAFDALLKKPLSDAALIEGLCKAIEKGNEHAFDALLKEKLPQEAFAEGLCVAIQKDNQTKFDALLPLISKKTLLNFKTKNGYGYTLIGLALIYVAEPCDRASDDKIPAQRNRFDALMEATDFESIDSKQLYFDNGQGCTALQLALNTEIVKFLLTKMSPDAVNAQNHNGDTALMFATRVCHWTMIEALLNDPNVDVNLQNKFGDTALKQIFSCYLKVDCLEEKEMGILFRLIAATKPENINHYGSSGTTIHAAISSRGSAEVLKRLLDRGADPKINLICDDQCISPLILAVQCGNAQMVQHLLQYGAVVDCQLGTSKQTALHWAAQRGDAEILEVLLDHIKERENQSDLLELIHLKNAHGDTALDRAEHCRKHQQDKTGHTHCIELLKPFNQTASSSTASASSAVLSEQLSGGGVLAAIAEEPYEEEEAADFISPK